MNPENDLLDLMVSRLVANISINKNVARVDKLGQIEFNSFPVTVVMYLDTLFSGKIVSTGPDEIIYTEQPIFGSVTYGQNETEALAAAWEVKQILTGYLANDLVGVEGKFPLRPFGKLVKEPDEGGLYMIGIQWLFEWKYNTNVVG